MTGKRTLRTKLTYKLTFLTGGALFAVLSYGVGTWLYSAELYLWGRQQANGDVGSLLLRIPTEHPLTFLLWLVATTVLAVMVGYLFDRQVLLRTRLEALAVTDGLTLVYNHRYLMHQLSLEIRRTHRYPDRLSVLMLDIDDFKHFNDAHGHLAGDDVLRLVAQAIRGSVRDTDVVARYGGEEFVVIAPGSDGRQGTVLAERIRNRIAEVTPVTVSIGVAGYPDQGSTVDELIKSADRALYDAKAAGKNNVWGTASTSVSAPRTKVTGGDSFGN